MPRRLLFILCLLSLAAGGRAQTQATLFAPVPLAPTPLAEGALIVSEESARRALALGFAATAAAQAEQLVAGSEPESAARDAAALLLTAARLELNDTPGALRALGNHGPSRPPAWHLRAGLIAARDGLQAEAQSELARLRVDALPEEERAWFYLLQGMVLEAGREPAKAAAAYDQAQAVAVSDWQRARFRLARERLRLNQEGSVTEEQANDLRKQAERYAGRGVGTDYAVQYAVALATLGREKDAVAWLEAQLAGLLDPSLAASRDDVRLMLGLIAGPAQAAGRGALEQLLGGGSDATKQRMALQLLAEATESTEARNRLRGSLDELLMRVPAHPLQEEMLLVRAELSLADLAYGRAEADAKELLARFPGSPQKARALTQLAAVAWEQNRFRTAADYATQAAAAASDPGGRAALRLLAAEALYRAGDYAASADGYAGLTASPPAGVRASAVMFQQVMARIEAGQLGQAAELIDRLAGDRRFDGVTRWQAEWNLARALQAERQHEVALARVSRVRAEADAESRPADLRARLAWLEARLARETGRAEDALKLARAIPGSLGGVEAPLAREIAGLARLIAAEALFNLDRGPEAVAELTKLREDMPGSEAALQSFIVEADIRATTGGLADAQALLTKFAEDYPDNPYAPYALLQAALNAERRGEDAYYQEAYVLLERLVNMPNPRAADLGFTARLKQGDLLRRLNQFPQAQQIYDLLVNRFAQHSDVLAAQMALGDCHRAQAAQDASHAESALTIFERLRDLASAPPDLRVEAGFKLGDMLAEAEPAEALAAWWPVVESSLIDRERAARLGVRGRYWMGRLLVRMAGVLEEQKRMDEAREAWRLIVDRGLPGTTMARARLGAIEAAR